MRGCRRLFAFQQGLDGRFRRLLAKLQLQVIGMNATTGSPYTGNAGGRRTGNVVMQGIADMGHAVGINAVRLLQRLQTSLKMFHMRLAKNAAINRVILAVLGRQNLRIPSRQFARHVCHADSVGSQDDIVGIRAHHG